jgi:hypothetical protein
MSEISSNTSFRSAKSEERSIRGERILPNILREEEPIVVPNLVKPSQLMTELRKLYKKEKEDEEKEKKIPKLDMLPDNRLRISDNLVLKATTRYISIAKTIQKDNPDGAQDTIWFLQQVFGRMEPSVKSDLERKINQLLAKTYKINGRKVNSIMIERGAIITYSPLEAEIPFGTIRLSGQWVLRAPNDFLKSFGEELDARKNMKYGYPQAESRHVYGHLSKISNLDDMEAVKVIVAQMSNDFAITIPEDFDIIEIPPIDNELIQAVKINNYIQLKRLLELEGISEYPQLVYEINEKINSIKLDKQVLTDIMVSHYFENYDFEPPSISEKIAVYKRMQRERENELHRNKKFVTAKGAIEKAQEHKRKLYIQPEKTIYMFPEKLRKLEPELEQYTRKEPVIETIIWNIQNVYVPESLRKVVRDHLSTLGSKGVEIEQAFYDAHGYIEPYILGIARITSNFDSFLSLKNRIMNGDLSADELVLASKKEILPELFLNEKLVADKKEFGRLNRMFEDNQAEEANSILQLWQPAVKKEWFPVSIAPNPFNPDKWLIDPVGKACAAEKIFVMTKNGIKCLSKGEIRDNLGEYLPYNRKDLATLLV